MYLQVLCGLNYKRPHNWDGQREEGLATLKMKYVFSGEEMNLSSVYDMRVYQ